MQLPLLNNFKNKLNIIIVGAHPDDPETGVAGTIAKYIKLGHQVTIVYLTKGEAGIQNKTNEEAATIREKEARNACKYLGCEVLFLDQIDGDTKLNNDEYKKSFEMIMALKPDLIFTHWPIDSHRDHRVCSNLIFDCWVKSDRAFSFYYFEAITGHQSQHFHPNLYIDISEEVDIKKKACEFHISQDSAKLWNTHEFISRMRGQESNCLYAEAFIKHDLSS